MTTASTLESRETVSLIGSDKVEGTAVYGADDKKFGKLERVMIDKISGKVAHAVLSFGGFMGMGEDYYPVPWSMLKYDTNLGGYRVCAVERRRFPVGASPTRQPLQPEATGAVMEVTKWLKPLVSVSRYTVTARVCRP